MSSRFALVPLNEPDMTRVLRNTSTLTAYRARMKAARRKAQAFYLVPLLTNPALFLPALGRLRPPPPAWVVCGVVGAWFVMVTVSLILGEGRRRRYLRNHPFDPA